MEILFLWFLSSLLRHCENTNHTDNYFSIVSVDRIKELPMQSFSYETEFIDDDYKGLGTYDEPQIECNIMCDTNSVNTIIVWGHVVISDMDKTRNIQVVDSVAVSNFILLRKNHRVERYSNKHMRNNSFDKPLESCPVPKSVRDKIKEDFLIRMKYRKYHVNTNERTIPVFYGYKL